MSLSLSVETNSHGQIRVGLANTRLLCIYHNCSNAQITSPITRTQACHRQNWFLPPIVKTRSSTPLFANNRHIPEIIPEKEA